MYLPRHQLESTNAIMLQNLSQSAANEQLPLCQLPVAIIYLIWEIQRYS